MGTAAASVTRTAPMEAQFHYTVYKFQAACCEHFILKSTDQNFPKETAGQYDLYLDVEMDSYKLYGASVFRNEETGHYLYRSKFGDWTVGKDMGKTKRGSKLRSWDVEEAKDKEAKFLRTCPCKVEKWQRRVVGEDGKVRWQKCDVELKIRRQKVSIPAM